MGATPPPDQEKTLEVLLALGSLSRGVAHEVNNTLTAVLGYLDLARRKLPAEHPARESVEKASLAADAAAQASRELLSAARQAESLPAANEFSGLLSEVQQLLREHREQERAGLPERDSRTPALGEGERWVVVAEGDDFVRSILLSGLRAVGYRARKASSLDELKALCDAMHPNCPIMVFDLDLDSVGGRAGAEELRRRHPKAPLILVSNQPDRLDELVSLERSCTLRKPFPISELLARVQDCGESPEERTL